VRYSPISDHLDWSDSPAYEVVLQAKLNHYLAFVESGEILESYPGAKGRLIVLSVVFNFPPDEEGREFLDRLRPIIESAGLLFAMRARPVLSSAECGRESRPSMGTTAVSAV